MSVVLDLRYLIWTVLFPTDNPLLSLLDIGPMDTQIPNTKSGYELDIEGIDVFGKTYDIITVSCNTLIDNTKTKLRVGCVRF